MYRIKSNVNLLIAISTIFLIMLNIIIYKFDYIYRPKSYILFFMIYLIVNGLSTYFSIKYRNCASKVSGIMASFMLIISLAYLFTLFFCFDLQISVEKYNIFYYELLFAITLFSSLVLFFVYNKVKLLKICMAVVTGIFVCFFAFFCFLSMIFSNFGENTVLRTVESPDNTYVAYVVSCDQGALGGSTEVYVRNIHKDINLVSGMLKPESKSKNLYSTGWGMEVFLRWVDNDTILINDIEYDVE